MNQEQLSKLIDNIYDAALNSESWATVSLEIQKYIGGHTVNFAIEDTSAHHFRYLFSNGVTASDVDYYQANVIQRDELTDIFENNPLGQALLTQNIWTLEQLERVWAYNEYYKGIGQTYFNAGKFYQADNIRAFIAVARSRFDSKFNASEQQKLQLILPHLARALFISKTLLSQDTTIEALGDTFERLSAAVIMLDIRGKVIFSNKKAIPFLVKMKNACSHYNIQLPNDAANLQLSTQINKMLNGSVYQEGTCLPFLFNGVRHIAYCFPWCSSFNHKEWFGDASRCIVFIVSSSSFTVAGRYLMALFKLSNAEVNIAEGLIRGQSTRELSQNLFVSEATVRFHVKNILRKTETNSQVAAVSTMVRNLVVSLP
ncbi:helix-turn-helix transcriptional regulator [Vibrio alginolyticus]